VLYTAIARFWLWSALPGRGALGAGRWARGAGRGALGDRHERARVLLACDVRFSRDGSQTCVSRLAPRA